MKRIISLVGALLVLLTSVDTIAKDNQKTDTASVIAQIQANLHERLPDVHIEKIQPSQWPYFYEVVTDGELFYVDSTGDYAFLGDIMDTKTRGNLTKKRWNSLLQIDFSTLPFDLALKEVKGDGSRKIAVFADPHCPFCSRFEKTLRDVDNVTVYTFLFPIEELHPGSTERSHHIWCAKDRLAAWHDWMLSQKDTPSTNCNTEQMTTVKQLGNKMKVTGTPTIIFEDGSRVPGAISKDDLEKELKNAIKKS